MQMRVSSAMLPPRLCMMQELTDGDVEWLNRQLDLTETQRKIRYTNRLPGPPPVPTGWVTTVNVRR